MPLPSKKNSHYGNILGKFCANFDGSGITPSYFPALMKWSLLVLPLISWHYFIGIFECVQNILNVYKIFCMGSKLFDMYSQFAHVQSIFVQADKLSISFKATFSVLSFWLSLPLWQPFLQCVVVENNQKVLLLNLNLSQKFL